MAAVGVKNILYLLAFFLVSVCSLNSSLIFAAESAVEGLRAVAPPVSRSHPTNKCQPTPDHQSSDVWSPALLALYPAAPVLSLIVCGRALLGQLPATNGSSGSRLSQITDGLIALPRSAAGWVYTVFALLVRWAVRLLLPLLQPLCCCLWQSQPSHSPALNHHSPQHPTPPHPPPTPPLTQKHPAVHRHPSRVLRARSHVHSAGDPHRTAPEAHLGAGVLAGGCGVPGAAGCCRQGAAGGDHLQAVCVWGVLRSGVCV